MPIPIRPADPADLDRLVELESSAFSGDRLSRRSLRSFLKGRGVYLSVAERAGAVTGYALVLFRAGSYAARLYSIAVDPNEAGKGVGRALLAEAEAAVRARGLDAMRLEVREDNPRALGLYQSGGYRLIGRREDYYEDGAAALRLEKRLAETPAGTQPETIK